MLAIKGQTDSPIKNREDDTLDLKNYADALGAFIKNADTPITIGIQGDWGSGKSSMMYLIKEELKKKELKNEKNPTFHTLWFNAWEFSHFDMDDRLSILLLSSFIDKIGNLSENDPDIQPIFKELKKTLSTIDSFKKMGDWALRFAIEKAGAPNVAKQFEDKQPSESENIANLKKELTELVTERLEKDKARIVVFIDDLDRLIPEKAVTLLESLKLFLDIEGCVFVLACDYEVITQGLKTKFGTDDIKGKSFFDKLIQVPFNMPVNHYNSTKFLGKMLEQLGISYENDKTKQEKDATLYLNLIAHSIGFNPRTAKRLFNNLLLLKFVLEKNDVLTNNTISQKNETIRIAFAVLCLQENFSEMYSKLRIALKDFDESKNPDVDKVNNYFKTLRQSPDEKSSTNDPKLAGFMTAFFEALQLQSDTSEDADNKLHTQEITTLKCIMSHSGMLTPVVVNPNRDRDRIRVCNRTLMAAVISDIEEQYKTQLTILSDSKDKFSIYQPNSGEKELDICIYFKISSRKNRKDNLQIVLWLTDGSRKHSTTGEQQIKHYIEDTYGEFTKEEWFKNTFGAIFPDAIFTRKRWETAFVYKEILPLNTERAVLEERFRSTALDVIRQIFDRIIELD
ncbi:MAG: hypothetical protein KAH77_05725 [Thiomargarita sp.]|nr:hypothetical protein [Thiomargarita sp.]